MDFSIIGVILALGSILFLAYVTTKYIGGKARKASKGNYIEVIESVSLGMDKQLLLVRVGEQFVLLSSSGKSIQFMTNITLEEYKTPDNSNPANVAFDFKSLFEKYIQSFKEKKGGKDASKDLSVNGYDPMDGVSIKSNLNRLKNITSLMNRKDKTDGDEFTNEK